LVLLDSSSSTGTNSIPQYISVHRREFERFCHDLIRRDQHFCVMGPAKKIPRMTTNNTNSTTIRLAWCDITYNGTVDVITRSISTNANDTGNSGQRQQQEGRLHPPIVLFRDGQNKEYDDTFPLRANITRFTGDSAILVEMWMTTMSSVHIGNPISSMDYIISHWRGENNMLPSTCWIHRKEE
jgi:hypothetical protein